MSVRALLPWSSLRPGFLFGCVRDGGQGLCGSLGLYYAQSIQYCAGTASRTAPYFPLLTSFPVLDLQEFWFPASPIALREGCARRYVRRYVRRYMHRYVRRTHTHVRVRIRTAFALTPAPYPLEEN